MQFSKQCEDIETFGSLDHYWMTLLLCYMHVLFKARVVVFYRVYNVLYNILNYRCFCGY